MNELGHGPWEKDYQPSGIVNDLNEGQIKAVQLTDGTYITEKLAKSMTKAQAAALRAFPGQPFIHDRCVFRMGYEQAEKDLAPLIEAAAIVYEAWNGGTMDDVRKGMIELGKRFN